MADKLEKDLLSQDTIDINADFVRMNDAAGVSYKNPLSDVAAAIITEFETTLGGSTRSVRTAINSHETTLASHETAINNCTSNIASLETRCVTLAEIEALEEKLGL